MFYLCYGVNYSTLIWFIELWNWSVELWHLYSCNHPLVAVLSSLPLSFFISLCLSFFRSLFLSLCVFLSPVTPFRFFFHSNSSFPASLPLVCYLQLHLIKLQSVYSEPVCAEHSTNLSKAERREIIASEQYQRLEYQISAGKNRHCSTSMSFALFVLTALVCFYVVECHWRNVGE